MIDDVVCCWGAVGGHQLRSTTPPTLARPAILPVSTRHLHHLHRWHHTHRVLTHTVSQHATTQPATLSTRPEHAASAPPRICTTCTLSTRPEHATSAPPRICTTGNTEAAPVPRTRGPWAVDVQRDLFFFDRIRPYNNSKETLDRISLYHEAFATTFESRSWSEKFEFDSPRQLSLARKIKYSNKPAGKSAPATSARTTGTVW